jgi:hypothetical protein
MELVWILKALWRKRVWVAVGGGVALLGALSVLYQPGLPPERRVTTVGAGSTEILIDAPQSTLGDIGRDVTSLVSRGGIFARYLATDAAAKEIGKEAGIPGGQITVAGPKLNIDGVPDQSSAKRAMRLGGAGGYLVQVQQGDDLPVLSIFTQAPTAGEARRLADGTAGALSNMVTRVQEETGVKEKRRLTIRQLGNSRAAELEEKPSGVLAIVVFCVLLGAFCLAILGWPRLVEAWRAPGPGQAIGAHGNGGWPGPLRDDGSELELQSLSGDRGLLLQLPTNTTIRDADGEQFDADARDEPYAAFEEDTPAEGYDADVRRLRGR